MYRLLLLLLSSQCVAAHCVACHATVCCCPSCHLSCHCVCCPSCCHRAAACGAVVCCPCRCPHAAPCVLGRGVLPTSPPPPRCPSCRHRVRVRPQGATHVAATTVLPPACRAVVCCPRCHRRRAAHCVAIEWLHVGPRCAARIVAAAALPVVL